MAFHTAQIHKADGGRVAEVVGSLGACGLWRVVAHGPGPEMRFATKFRCDCFLLVSFLCPPKFSPPRIWVSFIDFFILLFVVVVVRLQSRFVCPRCCCCCFNYFSFVRFFLGNKPRTFAHNSHSSPSPIHLPCTSLSKFKNGARVH